MRSSPVQVGTGSYRVLTAGNNATVAIDPYGTLSAWGENLYGQAGTNSVTSYSWTQLSNGDAHSLALRSDNTLWGWGLNTSGQLGTSDTIARQSPTQINANIGGVVTSTWSAVSAGASHSVAISSDNIAYGWGLNTSGQVGDITIVSRSAPVQIGIAGTPLNYSVLFNGVDYLSLNTATMNIGTSAFTIEAWVYVTSLPDTAQGIFGASTVSGNGFGIAVLNTNQADWKLFVGNGSTWAINSATVSWTNKYNAWYHFAISRTGGTLYFFLNGVLTYSIANSTNIPSTFFAIGAQVRSGFSFNGYISNFRVLIGSGLYTSNFTPSVSPFSNIANTVLLTCNGPTIIDSSSNNLTITNNGGATVSTSVNPFIYYSGSFNGTNQSLSIANSGGILDFGTGNFTIEFWVYAISAVSNLTSVFVYGNYANGAGLPHFNVNGNQGLLRFVYGLDGTTSSTYFTGPTWNLNIWYHVAIVRNINTVSFYVNGTLYDSGDFTGVNFSSMAGIKIGSGDAQSANWTPNYYFPGYISNFRAVKGTAVYTGNFTVPTNILRTIQSSGTNITALTGTETVLLTCQSSTFIDNSTNNFTITNAGSTTISSAIAPFQASTPAVGTGYFVASKVSAGNNYTLAIKNDNTLYSWGLNTSYQLGSGTTSYRSSPVQVGTSSWLQISAGATHALAIDINNLLYGWGTQASGQLGLGDTALRSQPTQIGASSYVATSAGYSHSIAVTSDNRLFTWGNNANGQLGFNVSFISVSAGNSITSVVRSDGTLWTWGSGTSGQLGDTTIVTKSSPVAVGLLTNWSKTTRPSYTNYAIDTTNKLYAWGENSFGAIGDNTTVNKSSPVLIGNSSWTMVATSVTGTAGQQSVYAIRSDGALFVWGSNFSGQLGTNNPPNLNLSSPVQLGTSSWSVVSGGNLFAMAITNDGKLYGWGQNNTGQLGIIPSTFTWSKIASSGLHTLAVRSDNKLYAWGDNVGGKLGDGSTVNKSSPVFIASGSYSQISAGLSNSYAIRSDGSLWSWGDNTQGQLGDPYAGTVGRSSPAQLGIGLVNSIYFPGNTSAVVVPHTTGIDLTSGDFTIECWAYAITATANDCIFNKSGTISTNYPAYGIQFLSSAWQFVTGNSGGAASRTLYTFGSGSTGAWNHFAVTRSGTTINTYFNGVSVTSVTQGTAIVDRNIVMTIGNQINGVAANGGFNGYISNLRIVKGTVVYTGTPFAVPTTNLSTVQSSSTNISALVGTETTLLTAQNPIYIDNSTTNANPITTIGNPTLTATIVPFTQTMTYDSWSLVSASQTLNYALATRSNNTLYGWGNNINGAIGRYSLQSLTNMYVSSPVQVSGGGSWTSISAGGGHSLAIKSDYKLYTWGLGNIGQTAQAGPTISWTQIAAGRLGTLDSIFAIRSDGALFAWGNNAQGQLGFGDTISRSSPVQLGSSSWSQVAASASYSTFAIRSDGILFGWGNNASGQIGDITNISRSSPTQIGSSSWLAIASGTVHTVGITVDGKLFTWGTNNFGQLGDPTLATTAGRSSPVQISAGTSWTSVATGTYHNLAIQLGGSLWSWGQNARGQLGLTNLVAGGDTVNRSAPVQITAIAGSSWSFVAAGNESSYAITNFKLYTWGQNGSGELGSGSLLLRSAPVQVGSSSWTYVGAGTRQAQNFGYAHGITTVGNLYGWGFNTSGQLGDGTLVTKSAPTLIGALQNWASVVGGIATNTSGGLFAWGNNTDGQLGQNTAGTNTSSPVAVGTSIPTILSAPAIIGSSSWTSVSAGGSHSMAIRIDGGLFAWGLNNNGQLGLTNAVATGDTTNRSSPVQVGADSWTVVSAGASHTLALKYPDNSLFTWGLNTSGQLGSGVLTARSSPVQVGTPVTTGYTTLYTSGSTYLTFSGITVGTSAYTAELWFYLNDGTFPTQRGLFGPSTRVSNAFNLRLNTATTINIDQYVSTASTFTVPTMLANTWYHLVAVRNASNVTTIFLNGVRSTTGTITMSNNYNGAFNALGGVPDASAIYLPGYISNFRMVVGTAVYDPTLATLTVPTTPLTAVTNTVLLTSQNSFLKDNSTNNSTITNVGGVSITPFSPFAGSGLYSALIAGANYSAGLDTGNNLYTWGLGTSGQIGDSTAVTKSNVTKIGTLVATIEYSPVQVGNDSWSQVSVGASHAVGIKLDNTVFAWGLNSSGQLGDASTVTRSSPVQVGTASSTLTDANAYSLTFDGTSKYLTTSAQTSSTYFGTGDFTIETWVNLTSTPTKVSGATYSLAFNGTNQYLTLPTSTTYISSSSDYTIEFWCNARSLGSGSAGCMLYTSSGGNYQIVMRLNGSAWEVYYMYAQAFATVPTSTIPLNQWHHMALVRISGTVKWYINGTQYATVSSNTVGASDLQIGMYASSYFDGYISNLRIVNGTGVYTSAFTPPTTPLAVITNTVLLTAQNSTIVDNSTNALTITNTGTVTVSNTSTPALYEYASIISVNDNWQWGWDDSASYGFKFMRSISKTDTTTYTGVLNTGIWYHIAVQRVSGTLSTWVNGVNTGFNYTDTTNYTSTNAIYIGRNRHPSKIAYLPGYISNLRIIKGQGLFSTTFTPSTSPLTTTTVGHTGSGAASSFTGTTILLTAQNTSIVDNSTTAFTFTNTGATVYSLNTPFTSTIPFGALFATQVSAGATHSVAIDTSSKLYGWGLNTSGQLGLNDLTSRSAPTQIGLATNWNTISAGADHTIATDSVGTLYTWGLGTTGQLGDITAVTKSSPILITSISIPNTSSPIQVGTSSYTIVSAGNNTTTAISSNSKLFVWGLNTTGQLGTGLTFSRSSPVQVSTSNSYSLISAGGTHTTVVPNYSPQIILATGLNTSGQLGDISIISRSSPTQIGASTTTFNSPVTVSTGNYSSYYVSSPTQVGTSSWTSISAGGTHTTGIKYDNTLWAWGYNANGQLADSTTINRSSPVQVGTSSWSQVGAGDSHNIAIKSDGTINAFGLNTYGQLGDGT